MYAEEILDGIVPNLFVTTVVAHHPSSSPPGTEDKKEDDDDNSFYGEPILTVRSTTVALRVERPESRVPTRRDSPAPDRQSDRQAAKLSDPRIMT